MKADSKLLIGVWLFQGWFVCIRFVIPTQEKEHLVLRLHESEGASGIAWNQVQEFMDDTSNGAMFGSI